MPNLEDMNEDLSRSEFQGSKKGSLNAQAVSRAVSLAGLGLMLAGLLVKLARMASVSIPGSSTLSLAGLLELTREPFSLDTMSIGILFLALLPAIRVLLASWEFIRRREALSALAALIVFLELLISIRAGFYA
jgi:uncharacterized membrane protein